MFIFNSKIKLGYRQGIVQASLIDIYILVCLSRVLEIVNSGHDMADGFLGDNSSLSVTLQAR